jgi:glucose-1-phosphate adenylyltransferase
VAVNQARILLLNPAVFWFNLRRAGVAGQPTLHAETTHPQYPLDKPMSLSHKVVVVVLAESEGRGLEPLTALRTKAAIPFGGKYRIIDFALANCMHSDLRRIFVLTQYKSHSLARHLRDGWSVFNPELDEFVTAVPPQMHSGNTGYSGSANALYQSLFLLKNNAAEHVLILPGDTIHRMDYEALLEQHMSSGFDVTLACKELEPEDADRAPTITNGNGNRVRGIDFEPCADNDRQLALGIVAVRLPVLAEVLEADHADADSSHDLVHDLLLRLIENYRARIYQFGGAAGRVTQDRYWRTVRTLDSYFNANMDLLQSEPPLDLYQGDWTIRTYQPQNPPARTVPGKSCNEGIFINSVVSGGTVIAGGGVNNSILFPRVRVDDAATVEHAILFEGVHVGERASLRNCIIDKYVAVPPDEQIGLDQEKDAARFTISDKGVVVVPRGYHFE